MFVALGTSLLLQQGRLASSLSLKNLSVIQQLAKNLFSKVLSLLDNLGVLGLLRKLLYTPYEPLFHLNLVKAT